MALKGEQTEYPKNITPGRPTKSAPNKRRWRGIALVFLCFVAGALGSAVVLLAGGDLRSTVNPDNTREVVSLEGELVAQIADEVGASTVSINTQSVSRDSFFGPSVQEGAGTGIIISSSGYVLTNRHVIPEGVGTVGVVTADGTEYEDVRVIGRDNVNDIAFLKIEGGRNLRAAKIGNSSEMEVGQKVVAVGNALGQFQNTVTTGVISGISRPITAQGDTGGAELLENLFQTDAAINPGNSGGPLVNLDGEVIGVNTAVAEGAEGIGFAIPINDVTGLIDSVKKEGRLIRPYIGLRAVTLTPDIAEQLGVEAESGAYIVEGGVVNGSPASEAGVRQGDVITKVDNREINEENSLSNTVSRFDVGQTVTLTIQRDGREQTLRATLKEFPDGP